jgi:hypothetical protein
MTLLLAIALLGMQPPPRDPMPKALAFRVAWVEYLRGRK